MAHINIINPIQTKIKRSTGETQIGIAHTSDILFHLGCNLLMELSTASAFQKKGSAKHVISVMGILDTGATRTSIDFTLAKKLNLIPIGISETQTAAGLQKTLDHAVDISFIGSNLKKILNLKIGSCRLGLNIEDALKDPNDPKNMGLLIGRDIMSLWNITWHGPTSTVFISD